MKDECLYCLGCNNTVLIRHRKETEEENEKKLTVMLREHKKG